jgi:photosystem II stability/assembly factor-like uncharacterized protein
MNIKGHRIIKTTMGLIASVILISCEVVPPSMIPSPTPVPVPTTESLPTATPVPDTVEPSQTPSPAEITPESEQVTDTPSFATAQSAAAPHFKNGEKILITYIHMVNITDGWGISGSYILTTSDGGKTWHEVTPPEPIPVDSLAPAYGAFPDEETAWVIYCNDPSPTSDPFTAGCETPSDASVWSTTDGGQTWIASPPLFHNVNAELTWAEFATVDSTTGWMMIRGVYVGAGTHYVAELFQTVDGVTWDPLDGDVGVDYTGMVFADEDSGWLTWQTTGAYAPAPPEYAVTGDSGFNWETYELPPPDDALDLFEKYEYCEPYQPNLLSPQSVRLLVACFDYSDPPENYTSYLYSSEDSGENWETYALPDKVNASGYTLIFFDNDNGLLLGRDMYQSEDGGETWTLIKTVTWDGQFSFVDDQNGWAVAENNDLERALVQTGDGGRTWVKLDPVVVR